MYSGFRFQGFRVSGFQGSGFQGFRVSGFQGFSVSGFQGFRVSDPVLRDCLACSSSFSIHKNFVIRFHFTFYVSKVSKNPPSHTKYDHLQNRLLLKQGTMQQRQHLPAVPTFRPEFVSLPDH